MDGDFGDPGTEMTLCDLGTGFVLNADDCDDTMASVNPTQKEICDELDNDCNGTVDDDPVGGRLFFFDGDGDGYGNEGVFAVACPSSPPASFVANSGDCNDEKIVSTPVPPKSAMAV